MAERTYAAVWDVVRAIPRGRVATYGQVAQRAPFPCNARFVGYALHALPEGSRVPWHRVINAQGRISFAPRSAPWREQRRRLQAEGVVFIADAVDLARFGWRARADSPLLPA